MKDPALVLRGLLKTFCGFAILFGFVLGPTARALPNRIVTLIPNLAEWVAEISGKDETLKLLVGVSAYSK